MESATCSENIPTVLAAIFATYSAGEFWLGRTKRIKSNSFIELFIAITAAVIVRLLTKGEKRDKGI